MPFQTEAGDYEQRCYEALTLQRDFVFQDFIPRCQAIGLERGQMEKLFPKFFLGVMNIYRNSDVDAAHFRESLVQVADTLLKHADAHKYHLSGVQRRDVGWDEAVDDICSVQKQSEIQIDHAEDRAYHDVYFPVVVGTQGPAEGRRIRSVISLNTPDAASEQIDVVLLNELTERFRRRMGVMLNQQNMQRQ